MENNNEVEKNTLENAILEDVLWDLNLLSQDLEQENFIEQEKLIEEEHIEEKTSVSSFEIKNKLKAYFVFTFKYIFTSSLIFWVLLLTTNYSAYTNIAKNYLFEDDLKNDRNMIINSVKASYIQEQRENIVNESDDEDVSKVPFHSIESLVKTRNKEKVNLKIDISPYENRIIIPKIAKNVPLLDVKNTTVSWEKELNNIFMTELENWVVRYPWSVKPWQDWNTFIFWHSSNFPWIKWDYNDVFSLLNNVVLDDEIIVYYGQKKYKYRIKEKKVINPRDVSVLKRDKGRSEITVMTCWPVWTTLNRLLVIWELVK